jgi:hypothetical protein
MIVKNSIVEKSGRKLMQRLHCQWNIITNDDEKCSLRWPEPNLVRGGVSFFSYPDFCPDGLLRNLHLSMKHEGSSLPRSMRKSQSGNGRHGEEP